jgi:hypothetical protein
VETAIFSMKFLLVFALALSVSNAKLVKRGAQSPGVWTALDQLRGKSKISNDDIRNMILTAKAGQDYPNLSEIPAGNFDCSNMKPGFYADVDTKCQVVRRCDINGNLSSYLCPNLTVFNQITLVCEWFWDVDCSKAKSFYDYSNSRLYQGHDVPLLDDESSYVSSRKKRAAQSPGVWTALDQLRGKSKISNTDFLNMFVNSKAGEDYPNLPAIPAGNFDCSSVKPGFYADVDSRCQVVRRCDINGNQSAYLCPNLTIFNQITLVCEWFWDVDCSKAKSFYDYSNSRLYQGHDVPLLDDESSYVSSRKKRAAQSPGVWTALDQLRGKSKISNDDIRNMILTAKAGQDYPNLSEIPAGNFDCSSVKPGFYADVDTKCQVVRRCDINGNLSSYLCPNLTVFNQITLVCEWFWDVDCSKAKSFYDYSNSRLYQGHDVPLLDDESSYVSSRKKRAAAPRLSPAVVTVLNHLRGNSKILK